jgi:hypothetical protein
VAKKIGENRLSEAIDRGYRELGGFFYPDSNIAQPMYPSRPAAELAKDADTGPAKSGIDERIDRAGGSRDDPGRDDPGRPGPEIDRE